jgi:hypothetical protein
VHEGGLVDDVKKHGVLADLTIKDAILHGVSCHQSIHVDSLGLSIAPSAANGLMILPKILS